MRYYNTSYINYNTFNEIENKIEELTQLISEKTYIIDYQKNIWQLNDWVYLEKVINIEKGIENLKKYFATPIGWITPRNWTKMASFSYRDINRWLNNLELIEKSIKEYEYKYITEFYCGEEVSL